MSFESVDSRLDLMGLKLNKVELLNFVVNSLFLLDGRLMIVKYEAPYFFCFVFFFKKKKFKNNLKILKKKKPNLSEFFYVSLIIAR